MQWLEETPHLQPAKRSRDPPLPQVQQLEMCVGKRDKHPTHLNEQVTVTPLCRQAVQRLEEDTTSPTRLNERVNPPLPQVTMVGDGRRKVKINIQPA